MLPEKWCIRQDASQEVCDWFNKKYNMNSYPKGYFTYLNSESSTRDSFYSEKIREGYKEITLEQFQKYVLKTQPMYSIKDLAEGRVTLEFNKETDNLEDLDRVIKEAFPEDKHIPSKYEVLNHYYFKQNHSIFWYLSNTKPNLPTQLLKDFLTMKKIIGYELKQDCTQYKNAVIEITGFLVTKYDLEGVLDFANFPTSIKILEKAKVLNLWFKEVLEEFKVGEYVTDDEGENIYKYGKLEKNKHYPLAWKNVDTTISFGSQLRKATQEEIESITKIMLPNSKYEIVVANEATSIDGYVFSKQFWEAAKTIAQHTKADVIVGCGAKNSIGSQNQWKLDLTTIKKVLDKLC